MLPAFFWTVATLAVWGAWGELCWKTSVAIRFFHYFFVGLWSGLELRDGLLTSLWLKKSSVLTLGSILFLLLYWQLSHLIDGTLWELPLSNELFLNHFIADDGKDSLISHIKHLVKMSISYWSLWSNKQSEICNLCIKIDKQLSCTMCIRQF